MCMLNIFTVLMVNGEHSENFPNFIRRDASMTPSPFKYELPPNPSRADIRVASFVGVHYTCKKSAIPKKFNASTPPYLLAPCLIYYYMHDLQWTVKLLWQVHIPTNSHCKSEDIIIRSVEVNRNAYMRYNTLPAKIRILDLGDSKWSQHGFWWGPTWIPLRSSMDFN